jgi:uncharacterized protein (DUF2249 family)
MATVEPLTLDVREDLKNGGEPLPLIMKTVGQLEAGQPLRLLATFEPLPLYAVLGKKGYNHSATQLGESDWEVLFTPGGESASQAKGKFTSRPDTDVSDWPAPSEYLDNRGLFPPEPLVRILETLEQLQPGEVLEAINERDPVFLYPELEQRGAAIRVDKRGDGVYLTIRRGEAAS